MELEFERDTILCYETVADLTVCQEETLESIVPDACPDILRIVDACGQAMLTGKQAKEGSANVTGTVRVSILYQPESESGLRRMEMNLPFTCQADAPGLTEQGNVQAYTRLRCAEARALNPRKVLLRVDLAVDVTACQPVERSICRGVLANEEHGLCQRQLQGETYELVSMEEKPFTFSDQVRLQSGQGEAPQLLAVQAQSLCTESKLIGSKLIFKGVVELSMLQQESSGALVSSRESMPFSQVLEVTQAGEDGDCLVQVELTDLHWDPDPGDSRNLEFTLELLAQTQVRCRRPVTLLLDLYSTAFLTQVDSQPQVLCQLGESCTRAQTVRELLETGEMVRGVVGGRFSLGQVSQSREGSQLILTAEAWLTVLYQDEEQAVRTVNRTLPVVCRLDCPEQYSCKCTCSAAGEVFAVPAAGGMEVRFSVEFHCLTTVSRSVPSVIAARLTEPRGNNEGGRPSVVLRLAAPGEGLWEIAKTYGTTIEQILQANELPSEQLPEGRMLLIPSIK